MAAGSRLCRIAAIGLQLAAFFRSIGQIRLADTLERIYGFLYQIGQCNVPAPVPAPIPQDQQIRKAITATAELDELSAALELGKRAVEWSGESF